MLSRLIPFVIINYERWYYAAVMFADALMAVAVVLLIDAGEVIGALLIEGAVQVGAGMVLEGLGAIDALFS